MLSDYIHHSSDVYTSYAAVLLPTYYYYFDCSKLIPILKSSPKTDSPYEKDAPKIANNNHGTCQKDTTTQGTHHILGMSV